MEAVENRDKAIVKELANRDNQWLNSLHHVEDNLKKSQREHINNRLLLESLAKRQRELAEAMLKSWNGQ